MYFTSPFVFSFSEFNNNSQQVKLPTRFQDMLIESSKSQEKLPGTKTYTIPAWVETWNLWDQD